MTYCLSQKASNLIFNSNFIGNSYFNISNFLETDWTTVRTKYSDHEDKFIVQEVSKHIDKYRTIYSKEMWTNIATVHREKWLQGTIGFPQERTEKSLSYHFVNVILRDYAQRGEELPINLIQRLNLLQQTKIDRGHQRINRRSYSIEEDNLILDELKKPSCTGVFGVRTLQTILDEIEKKHEEKARGFENVRTYNGLRSHLSNMKKKGQFPMEIMKKFWVLEEVQQSRKGWE